MDAADIFGGLFLSCPLRCHIFFSLSVSRTGDGDDIFGSTPGNADKKSKAASKTPKASKAKAKVPEDDLFGDGTKRVTCLRFCFVSSHVGVAGEASPAPASATKTKKKKSSKAKTVVSADNLFED